LLWCPQACNYAVVEILLRDFVPDERVRMSVSCLLMRVSDCGNKMNSLPRNRGLRTHKQHVLTCPPPLYLSAFRVWFFVCRAVLCVGDNAAGHVLSLGLHHRAGWRKSTFRQFAMRRSPLAA
jgi:hypothetical protein